MQSLLPEGLVPLLLAGLVWPPLRPAGLGLLEVQEARSEVQEPPLLPAGSGGSELQELPLPSPSRLRAQQELVRSLRGPQQQQHLALEEALALEGALARLQPSLLLVLFLAPAPGLVPLHLPRTLSAG